MNLKNGYRVIYEKIANGYRTFYATKNITCDPTVDDKIVEAEIGKYKLIYEKAGRFYGSETGIPAADPAADYCFEEFDAVFVEKTEEPAAVSEPVTPVVEPEIEEPIAEPEVTEIEDDEE